MLDTPTIDAPVLLNGQNGQQAETQPIMPEPAAPEACNVAKETVTDILPEIPDLEKAASEHATDLEPATALAAPVMATIPPMPVGDKLLTVLQVARLLALPEWDTYSLVYRRRLPSIRISGRLLLKPEEVGNFLKRRKEPPS